MDQDRGEQALDVLGDDVAASVEQRPRAGGALERKAPAHRAPDDDRLLLARGAHELDDPAVERVVDVDVLRRRAELLDLVEADHRLERLERMRVALLGEDPQLVLDARVAERGAEEEAVELGLGQRERALVLDRVLGREQQEGVRQLSRDAVDRHLLLGHRLEQRGLRLRSRPVDLVDEDDVREDRAGPELEPARLLVEDREPGDVRRLEIRRALDPLRDRALDAPCDRPREHGLRRARDVLEQDVAVAGERGEHELDLAALPVDDGLDVVDETIRDGSLARAKRSGSEDADDDRLHGRDGIDGRLVRRDRHRGSGTSTKRGCWLQSLTYGIRAQAAACVALGWHRATRPASVLVLRRSRRALRRRPRPRGSPG